MNNPVFKWPVMEHNIIRKNDNVCEYIFGIKMHDFIIGIQSTKRMNSKALANNWENVTTVLYLKYIRRWNIF